MSPISARISATISTSLLALAMFARLVSEFVVDFLVSYGSKTESGFLTFVWVASYKALRIASP